MASHITKGRVVACACVVVALVAIAGTALAQTPRQTTAQGTLALGGPLDPAKPGFRALVPAAANKRVVRNLPGAYAQPNRTKRRASLAYFGYLNDFQLADEESPARIDSLAPLQPNTSSWRPQEALVPQTIDAAFRRLDAFAPASPNAAAKGRRARMMMALLGGDQVDNQQENEMTWLRQLIEGGQTVDPNSGVSDYSSCTLQQRADLAKRPADEAARYTGLQDYTDYNGGQGSGNFWDPNQPAGAYAQWPAYPGLMDAAQRPFVSSGLRDGATALPTYVTTGNHDAEVQGYVAANAQAQAVATGCFKPFIADPLTNPAPYTVFGASTGFAVPPDPRRRFVGPTEMKGILSSGAQRDGHGFGFVDPSQNAASAGTAAYYAWSPKRNLRFISLDTSSVGTSAVGGAEGNIDDPQYQWLRGELRKAKAAKQYVVVFGHHPIRRLIATTPDESAPACNGSDVGCDADPRPSTPIHLRADLERVLNANPNVVAYLSAHTHVNRIRPCATRCTKKGNWWSVESTSATDFSQQSKLVEVMNNKDGTLSTIITPVDQSGGATPPAPGSDPNAFGVDQMASLSRELAANDPRAYRNPSGGISDRNVELVSRDPFAGRGAGLCTGLTPSTITGGSVNGAVLARKRATVRKALAPKGLKAKASRLDRYCLVGGGYLRVGYTRDRARLLLSSSKANRLARLKVGSATKTVRARLRGEFAVKLSGSTFYLGRASKARVVVEVRKGRVRQLGLADRGSTRSAKSAKRFLGAFL